MNEVCVEQCNPNRDASGFEMKKGIELPDLPRFPLDEFLDRMTADERKTIMAVYMAKTTDYLQGVKDEPEPIIRRPHHYSPRVSPLPEDIQSQGVLHDPAPDNTIYQAGEKCEDQNVRSNPVVESSD